MYEILWIFVLYSFFGWCTEVCYAATTTGRFINRGFLSGPVCPIYGFGVLLVLRLLAPLEGSLPLLFLGSMALTSGLELGAGFLLERLFHQRWWDYSHEPFHLGGYICLRFSLLWALACLLVVRVLHPSVHLLIAAVPHTLGIPLLVGCAGMMGADFLVTVRTVTRLNRSLGQMEPLVARMRELSNGLGETLAEGTISVTEKGEELRENLSDLREDFDDWRDGLTERREELGENLTGLAAGLREELRENLADWREDFDDWRGDLVERREDWKQSLLQRGRRQREELRELRHRLDALMEGTDEAQRRLLRAFPRMRSLRHGGAVEWLRQRLFRRP